ncbi:5-(carboxyamino)imidazole ribonucleotide mutase [bacterium]
MSKLLVGIIIGSDSDLAVMKESAQILEQFDIDYEITISSAHRTLDKTLQYAKSVEQKGIEVMIVGAGMAAHLAGVIAAEVIIPVIGVPMYTSSLGGVDSLYSMVQMPGGIPVATMSIGSAGAKNAGILAAEILSIKYPQILEKLKLFRKSMAKQVTEKDEELQNIGYKKYLEKKSGVSNQ